MFIMISQTEVEKQSERNLDP